MTPAERRSAVGLAGIYALRMLGLFLILPVFAVQAQSLAGATPLLIGLAIGAYGLTQALLQIPFGLLSDRIGRKPVIFAGLTLFAVGSMVAAMSDSIHGVILGRVLQGSGAIAAAVMALTADLTREEVRTRAMASIGVSIGLSFALALVLGPALAHWLGLDGIFWFISLLAVGGILILALVVPSPDRSSVHRDAEPVLGQLGGVLRSPELLRLDFGIFCLHLTMTSLFLVVPLALRDFGLPVGHHWWIYLPVLALSVILMVPFIIQAESRGRMRPIFLGAVLTLATAMMGLHFFATRIAVVTFWLVLFFVAVNLLEASLPSLVSKLAPAAAKGTAMGVYSTSQFIGAFVGGVLGGWVHQVWGQSGVFLFAASVALVWFAVAWPMGNPGRLGNLVIRTGAVADASALRQGLLAVPGVEDAEVIVEEGLAYLKVDNARLDSARLQQFSVGV
jgi:predicted MFS family arabinose efflux permease